MTNYRDKTVAYIDRSNDDEIIEVKAVKALPSQGQHVTFADGDAAGAWQVSVVQPLPGSPVFDAMVYLDRL